MKKKKYFLIMILAIIFIGGLWRTIEKGIEETIYKDYSLEEIMNEKFKTNNYGFIEDENFYFVLYNQKKEIIEFKEDGKRKFFSSGISPKIAWGKQVNISAKGFSGTLVILKEGETHIMYVYEQLPDELNTISDTVKNWSSIKNDSGKTLYSFCVVTNMGKDYEIYVGNVSGKQKIADYYDIN